MLDSESTSPQPKDSQTPSNGSRMIQRLSELLEFAGCCGKESFGISFACPKLEVSFVTDMGRRILCPSFEGRQASSDFAIRDIVSLSDRDKFDATVMPLARAVGGWNGELTLRSLWGGDVSSEVRLWYVDLGEDLGGKHLLLHAKPIRDATFQSMRGWRDRELLLALLVHSKSDIYFKDRESRFIRASNPLISRFGLKYPHEVIGKTDFHFFGAVHAAAAYEDEQEIIRTGVPIVEKVERETWDDGDDTWGSTSKFPLYDWEGKIIGTFGITRDITAKVRGEAKRKELEQRLHLAQRLESIGSLAAGVAHEINTPTQFVADNVKFLGDAFSDYTKIVESCLALVEKVKGIQELDPERERVLSDLEELDYAFLKEEVPQTVQQSADGLRQIAKIVGSLKEFSYPASPEKSKADLNHAIENTLNISRNFWKGVAEIDLELAADLPEVDCMIDQINQVFLNLIVNAAQAIEATESRSGLIKIKTSSDGACVIVEVSDTGIGMTDEVRARIFEPFFTTKEVGQGTGQGLAMARNLIVKTHLGQLDCESELGRGTTFRVTLPIEAPREGSESEKGI